MDYQGFGPRKQTIFEDRNSSYKAETDLYQKVEDDFIRKKSLSNKKSQKSYKLLKFVQSREYRTPKIRFQEEFQPLKITHKRARSELKPSDRPRQIQATPNYFGTVVETSPGHISKNSMVLSKRLSNPRTSSLTKLTLPVIIKQSKQHVDSIDKASGNKMYFFQDVDENHRRFMENVKKAKNIALNFHQKVFNY